MYRILAYVVTIREDLWTRLPEMGKIEKYPDNDNQDGNRVRGRFGHRSSSKKSNSHTTHTFTTRTRRGACCDQYLIKKSWQLLKSESWK